MNSLIKTLLLFSLIILHANPGYSIGFTVSKRIACRLAPILLTDTTTPPPSLTIVSRKWTVQGSISIPSVTDTVSYIYTTASPGQTITLRVYYSDGDSADWSDPVPIRVLNPPTATMDVDYPTICLNEKLIFTVFPVQGDSFLDSDTLFDGHLSKYNLFPTVTFYETSYALPGKYYPKYKIVDQNGCIGEAMDTVTVVSPTKVSFDQISLSCRDSNVLYQNTTYQANRFKSWRWDVLDSVSSMIEKRFPLPGDSLRFNYTWRTKFGGPQYIRLQGEDSFKCKDSTDFIEVMVDTSPILVVDNSVDTIICFGESLKYFISGADKLRWGNFTWGDTITSDSSRVVLTPKNTITYTVYGLTKNCPPSGKDIKIRVVQPLETKITLTPDIILKGNKSILALGKNGITDSIKWSPDSTVSCGICDTTNASPPYSTMYRAKLYYGLEYCQCYAEDSAFLRVDSTCNIDSLRIPTAFTPNGDLTNDEFYLKAFSVKNIIDMNIYNRWGNKVFHAENVAPNKASNGWNGRLNNNGDDLPPGLYVYNITATCVNNQTLNFQGEINLLR